MKVLAYLLCAVLMATPVPRAVAFCNVPQPRLVCAEYFKSQLVVEAKLDQIKAIRDETGPDAVLAHVYTLEVNRVIRGTTGASVQVYEGEDSGRATFDWVLGKRYLLFLFRNAQENSWALDGCGNSGPLDKAGAALSKIEAIKRALDGGTIYGIVSQQALSRTIPGVHVEAQGKDSRYAAATNDRGEFQMNVPAGHYSVLVVEHGVSFEKTDISYEDPAGIQIEPGGCAQIQFAEVEGSQ